MKYYFKYVRLLKFMFFKNSNVNFTRYGTKKSLNFKFFDQRYIFYKWKLNFPKVAGRLLSTEFGKSKFGFKRLSLANNAYLNVSNNIRFVFKQILYSMGLNITKVKFSHFFNCVLLNNISIMKKFDYYLNNGDIMKLLFTKNFIKLINYKLGFNSSLLVYKNTKKIFSNSNLKKKYKQI